MIDRIAVDAHTHTVLSGHAWSTLMENAQYAAQTGLAGLCTTEHGHSIPMSTPEFLASAHKLLPAEICGVRIYKGLEMNIIDFTGRLDVEKPGYLAHIEFGIASLHDVVLSPGSIQENTDAFLAALENPHVDLIGHPGNPVFPCDIERVVRAAKDCDKLIEINNNSFRSRSGSHENCVAFAKQCKQMDVRVCVNSDAHFAYSIGVVNDALTLLAEVDFPEALIVNATLERFEAYLAERARRIG